MKRGISNGVNSNVYHITYSPKSRTACLYFAGCNFRCLGCIREKCNFDIHLGINLQKNLEKGKATNLSRDGILDILSKVEPKPEKLIFMGGEPSIDPNFTSLTKELKMKLRPYNILLTNGYNFVEPAWLDEVCVGIKAKSPGLHREYTGKDSKQVFKNLESLNETDVILRTESMFIPDYIGFEETERIVKAVSKINPNIPHRIDAYIPVPGAKWRRPTQKEIKEVMITAKKYLRKVGYIKMHKRYSATVKVLV